jgi:hypothetical protein
MALVWSIGCSQQEPVGGGLTAVMGFDTSGVVALEVPHASSWFNVRNAVFSGSRLAVVDNDSSIVRVFTADGRYLTSFGASGEGPGQFRRISAVQGSPDGFIVVDAQLSRLTWWDSAGSLLRTLQIPPDPELGTLTPIGVLASGEIVARTSFTGSRDQVTSTPRLTADSALLLTLDTLGRLQSTIGVTLGSPQWIAATSSGQRQFIAALSARRDEAVAGERAYLLDPPSAGLRAVDKRGETIHWFSGAHSVDSLDVEGLHAFRMRQIERLPGLEEALPANLGYSEFPVVLPRYGWGGYVPINIVTVSGRGDVWLLRYGGLVDDVPIWDVFDSTAVLRGSVRGPAQSQLLAVNDSTAVLKLTAASGIETVVLMPLAVGVLSGR